MLKWLPTGRNLRSLFKPNKQNVVNDILKFPEGKRYYQEFHSIRRGHIDPDALKVIGRLQQFGHKAYLVGGSVRDLLLGIQPKDYDIVTSAKPNEVKKIFANSRIIGKRFRIVHVVFRGNKIIEVATARSLPETRKSAKDEDDLYLTRDNMYGTFKEDAARRDFTINSLFYDVRNESILDYTGGLQDINNRIVRVISTEKISFPEDPVRMLRAVKFAAILDFDMHGNLLKGIKKYRKMIRKASLARLHEELNKIFRTGKSARVFKMFADTRLFEGLFPELYTALNLAETEFEETPLFRRLEIADRMIQEHEDINTNIYYGLILYDVMKAALEGMEESSRQKRSETVEAVLKKFGPELGLTRKESDRLNIMFTVQNQFLQEVDETKSWIRSFKSKEFFPEAFILYKIGAISEKDDESIQKALFWEIGLRKKLQDAIRKNWVRTLPAIDDRGPAREPKNRYSSKSGGRKRYPSNAGARKVTKKKSKQPDQSGSKEGNRNPQSESAKTSDSNRRNNNRRPRQRNKRKAPQPSSAE